ncbi:MAG: TonB-dependent receptor [Leptospirales bacterium]|nr:TonB-dependent receptor [Leptospirales bacterium]
MRRQSIQQVKRLSCIAFLLLAQLGLLRPALAEENSSVTVWIAVFQPAEGERRNEPLEQQLQTALATAFAAQGYAVERGNGSLSDLPAGAGLAVGGYYARSSAGRVSLYGLIVDRGRRRVIDATARNSVLDLPGASAALSHVRRDLEESDGQAIERFAGRVVRQAQLNPDLRLRQDNLESQTPSGAREDLAALWPGEEGSRAAAREAFELLENQTVVTATRSQSRLRDTPSTVYVITERQIRERGYRTLIDALEDLPGFDTIHVYGIFPELVHPRGLVGNNQRTLVYVDGVLDTNISERAPRNGTLHFPLFNVERIEVVMGPSSALYGANAFGGVIQIFTKGGDVSPGAEAEVGYGRYLDRGYSPGAHAALASRGRSNDSEMHYSASAWFNSTRGPYFGDRQSLRPRSVDENDPRWQLEKSLCGGPCTPGADAVGFDWSPYYDASAQEDYNITARFQSGGFSLRTVNWQFRQPYGTFANAGAQVDTHQMRFKGSDWDFRNNAATMGYNASLAQSLSLESEIGVRHTEVLGSSSDVTVDPPDPLYYYRLDHTKGFTTNDKYARADYSLEWREKLEWNASRRLQTIAGIETTQESTPRGYGVSERFLSTTYAGYLQVQILPLDAWTVLLGYRYDLNTDYGYAHTPRLGLTYQPWDWLSLKAVASAGFRAPTAWELYNETPQRRSNPDLKPERMRSYEFGAGLRFLRDYYLQTALYRNEISDLLLEVQTTQPRPVGGYYNQNKNVGRAQVYGAEARLDARPWESLNFDLGYNYNHGEYRNLPPEQSAPLSVRGRPGDDPLRDYLASYSGRRVGDERGDIPNISPHRVFASVVWRPWTDLSVSLRVIHYDVRRTIANNPERTIPGYYLTHINIRWENFLGWSGFYAALLIRNAGDISAYDPGIRIADGSFYPSRHPLEERNVWLSIGYKF